MRTHVINWGFIQKMLGLIQYIVSYLTFCFLDFIDSVQEIIVSGSALIIGFPSDLMKERMVKYKNTLS